MKIIKMIPARTKPEMKPIDASARPRNPVSKPASNVIHRIQYNFLFFKGTFSFGSMTARENKLNRLELFDTECRVGSK
jgi:hypothetical protein